MTITFTPDEYAPFPIIFKSSQFLNTFEILSFLFQCQMKKIANQSEDREKPTYLWNKNDNLEIIILTIIIYR